MSQNVPQAVSNLCFIKDKSKILLFFLYTIYYPVFVLYVNLAMIALFATVELSLVISLLFDCQNQGSSVSVYGRHLETTKYSVI